MKKTIRLTEADLSKLIRRVIKEIDGNVTPVMNNMESRKRRINVK